MGCKDTGISMSELVSFFSFLLFRRRLCFINEKEEKDNSISLTFVELPSTTESEETKCI